MLGSAVVGSGEPIVRNRFIVTHQASTRITHPPLSPDKRARPNQCQQRAHRKACTVTREKTIACCERVENRRPSLLCNGKARTRGRCRRLEVEPAPQNWVGEDRVPAYDRRPGVRSSFAAAIPITLYRMVEVVRCRFGLISCRRGSMWVSNSTKVILIVLRDDE